MKNISKLALLALTLTTTVGFAANDVKPWDRITCLNPDSTLSRPPILATIGKEDFGSFQSGTVMLEDHTMLAYIEIRMNADGSSPELFATQSNSSDDLTIESGARLAIDISLKGGVIRFSKKGFAPMATATNDAHSLQHLADAMTLGFEGAKWTRRADGAFIVETNYVGGEADLGNCENPEAKLIINFRSVSTTITDKF